MNSNRTRLKLVAAPSTRWHKSCATIRAYWWPPQENRFSRSCSRRYRRKQSCLRSLLRRNNINSSRNGRLDLSWRETSNTITSLVWSTGTLRFKSSSTLSHNTAELAGIERQTPEKICRQTNDDEASVDCVTTLVWWDGIVTVCSSTEVAGNEDITVAGAFPTTCRQTCRHQTSPRGANSRNRLNNKKSQYENNGR